MMNQITSFIIQTMYPLIEFVNSISLWFDKRINGLSRVSGWNSAHEWFMIGFTWRHNESTMSAMNWWIDELMNFHWLACRNRAVQGTGLVASSSSSSSSSSSCAASVPPPPPPPPPPLPAPHLVAPLPSARRYVAVRLLTGETLQFDVEVTLLPSMSPHWLLPRPIAEIAWPSRLGIF